MKKFLIALALVSSYASADSNKCVWFKTSSPGTPLQQAVFYERIRQDIRNANHWLNPNKLSNLSLVSIGQKLYCEENFDKQSLKQIIRTLE